MIKDELAWHRVPSHASCSSLVLRSVTPRPEPLQPPAGVRASPVPHVNPYHCVHHSPECASFGHNTAYGGSGVPSSPPPTRHRGRPGHTHTHTQSVQYSMFKMKRFGMQKLTVVEPAAKFSFLTCLLAKMSSKASLSSFSVSSLASSLWASISLSLWQLSITNTTAVEQERRKWSTVKHWVCNTHCVCV